MPDNENRICAPSHLPTYHPETGELLVVIETTRGSRNKYNYDEALCSFICASVLPEGASFPFDFGFIPRTRGEDGDPLDVLLLTDAPVTMGCAVPVRLVGVIEARQTEKDGKTVRNDRLLAVAAKSILYEDVRSLKDLSKALVTQVEEFFISYNRIKGKRFKPLGLHGPTRAKTLLKESLKQYRAHSK
jgi:inorganic pyrophosphatase